MYNIKFYSVYLYFNKDSKLKLKFIKFKNSQPTYILQFKFKKFDFQKKSDTVLLIFGSVG